MSRRFLQLDVFTHRAGAGNTLAVVLDPEGLDSTEMQRFAAWTQLPETTFLLPPTTPEASYRLRIFTPRREVPFAGHPSIGTAYAALESGRALPRDGHLIQEGAAGLLPLRVEGEGATRRIYIRAPASRIAEAPDLDPMLLANAWHGLARGALPPTLVEGGRRWWMVELADEAAVRGMAPDLEAIAGLARASDTMGLCVFARCHGQDYGLVVRAFLPAHGHAEDPASGAANAMIAAFLQQCGALGELGSRYVSSQGREIGRDARIELSVDSDGAVWVGGQTKTVIRGELDW